MIIPNTAKISEKDAAASKILVPSNLKPEVEKDSDASDKLVSSIVLDTLAL